MLNIDRLKMEIKNIELSVEEYEIYLAESDLIANEEYISNDPANKKGILIAALSVLESIANDTTTMKHYAIDDITVSQYHENLMARIDQLQNKINNIQIKNNHENSSTFMLFDS